MFLIPIFIIWGVIYLIGELLFSEKLLRWIFVIAAFLTANILSGIILWHRIGLIYFMETVDELGQPIAWLDGNIGDWLVWIASTSAVCLITSMVITWAILVPFRKKKKWWQFWKH